MADDTPTPAIAEALATKAAAWVKLAGGPDEAMRDCASAVHALVSRLPVGAATPWADDTTLGAVMLTARLHRRRNSAAGIEAMTELGATYVSRYDNDIARLLRIDSFQTPVAI